MRIGDGTSQTQSRDQSEPLDKSILARVQESNLTAEVRTLVAGSALALLLVAILIAIAGKHPVDALHALYQGALGSRNGFGETLVKTTPLLLTAVGAIVAFRCGVWNIGLEGQLYLGALGAAIVGIYLPPLPALVHIPILFLGGFAFGAAWAAIPGFFKARFDTNEILTTIMMNYIAVRFISYLVNNPLKDQSGFIPLPQTRSIQPGAVLPEILSQTRAHAGILVAVAVVGIMYLVISRTVLGYEIQGVGKNREAAEYGGISFARSVMLSMVISGGLAGVAGAAEIAGIHHVLQEGFSPGYGDLAIVIALVGGLHPVGTAFVAFFFGALMAGAESMQRAVGIPTATVNVIVGILLIFVLAQRTLRQREPRGEVK